MVDIAVVEVVGAAAAFAVAMPVERLVACLVVYHKAHRLLDQVINIANYLRSKTL